MVYKHREEGTAASRKEVEFAYKSMLDSLKREIEAGLKKTEEEEKMVEETK